MYCEKCGSKNSENATFCTNCGNKLSNSEPNDQVLESSTPVDNNVNNVQNSNVVTNEQKPVYNNVNNAQTNVVTEPEGSKFGWGVLGFFVPLVGLILYFTWKKDRPKSSKAAVIGALISVILNLVLTIVIVIIGVTMGIRNVKDSYDYKEINIDNYDDSYEEYENEEDKKTINAGEKFEFSNLEIIIGTDYTFTTLDNSNSENNGMVLVKLPITIKNLSKEENHLNMFYSSIFDPNNNKLTKQSTYFDDAIDYADDLKENEIYTKYYYFEYKTDGTYKVKFNNYKQEIEVNVNIKK